MTRARFASSSYRLLNRVSAWKVATAVAAVMFFTLSVRWSCLDNSPPAWDQGLYLYQATLIHKILLNNGLFDFVVAILTSDRGRVPLLSAVVQPAFYFFGSSLDAAVISINFAWFLLAWVLPGIAREFAGENSGDMAGFFAFVLFGVYSQTTFLSHTFLVEFLLVTFVSASIYSLWLSYKTKETKWSIVSGIFFSLGLLTKVTFSAFVLPSFIILLYRNIRSSSVKSSCILFSPAIIIITIIAVPYYCYNFRQLTEMTRILSSQNMANLYGFKGAFDIGAIAQFLYSVFVNAPMLIAVFCALSLSVLNIIQFRGNNKVIWKSENGTLITILIVWLIIPFFLVTFGAIKEARYAYPSLIPIFLFAGTMISRYFHSQLSIKLFSILLLVSSSGYLYSNNLLPKNLSEHKLGPVLALDPDSRPDSREWQIDELVREISQNVMDVFHESKTVFFLGGNRYYHLKLLDYTGLMTGAHLNYIVLPYYSNPSGSLDDAMKYIAKESPDAVIYKSGKNWPEFSSRLDAGIVSKLKSDPKYEPVDLNTVQPDGSRFTLYVNRTNKFLPIVSASHMAGNWKAGEGLASLVSNKSGGLKLTTETGAQEVAIIQNGKVVVPNWNLSGILSEDSQRIRWSNGFVWNRSK